MATRTGLSPDAWKTCTRLDRPNTRSSPNRPGGHGTQTSARRTGLASERSQPDPRVRWNGDYGINPSTRAKTDANAVGPSTRIRRPSDNVMSMRCAETGALIADTTNGSFAQDSVPSISTGKNAAVSLSAASPSNAKRGSRNHCGSDWRSSNTDVQLAQPKHQEPAPACKSTASLRQTKTASSSPSCPPWSTQRCPLSMVDTIKHSVTPSERGNRTATLKTKVRKIFDTTAVSAVGAQSGREHLAVHARQLALKSRLQILQGDPRSVRPGLEQTRRTTMDHNVNQQAGMGSSVRINCAWYDWTPTSNMISADPEVKRPLIYGLRGGEVNPLGARALYFYVNGKDTLFRIHGTDDPSSIGKSVFSGCIRMHDLDVLISMSVGVQRL